jgi:hypothetical protein
MSLAGSVDSFYMHADSVSDGVANIMAMLENSVDSSVAIERAWDGTPGANLKLPPSSLQSFLKQKRDIPGITIGDFKDKFSNPNFNSEFDKGKRFLTPQHADKLCQLVNATARMIYKWANSPDSVTTLDVSALADPPSTVVANCDFIADLLDCYTVNPNCTIFNSIPVTSKTNQEFSAFQVIDTPGNYPTTFYTYVTYFLSWNITGQLQVGEDAFGNTTVVNCTAAEDCDAMNYLCVYGNCVRSSTSLHPAYGAGIEYSVNSGKFYVADSSRISFYL